jgi:hypothetical protein
VIAVDGATIYLDDGKAFEFSLYGDCCRSSSNFTPEGLEAFRELIGTTILRVEDRAAPREGLADAPTAGEDQARERRLIEKYPPLEYDRWHFVVFRTNKGHVTIDWRNESNGYYDGGCSLVEAAPLEPVVQDALLEGKSPAVKPK